MTKSHSIQSEFTLQYIPITDYYIVKDTHLDNQQWQDHKCDNQKQNKWQNYIQSNQNWHYNVS